MYKFVF